MTIDTKDKIDGATPTPSLDDLFAMQLRRFALDLRVAAPAIVNAFDPVRRRATVTLGFLPVLYVGDEEIPQAPIVCPDVPVAMPGDALSYLHTPIVPGATGLVVFADRCLARFLQLGTPDDPINGRTHALGDGVFYPCAIGPTAAPVDPTGTVLEGTLVKLGAAAAQPALLGTALTVALGTWLAAVTSAASTWAGLAPGAPAFAAALQAANTALAGALAATLSTKVLVQ